MQFYIKDAEKRHQSAAKTFYSAESCMYLNLLNFYWWTNYVQRSGLCSKLLLVVDQSDVSAITHCTWIASRAFILQRDVSQHYYAYNVFVVTFEKVWHSKQSKDWGKTTDVTPVWEACQHIPWICNLIPFYTKWIHLPSNSHKDNRNTNIVRNEDDVCRDTSR